jgi:signal transduction histidine kinase
MEDEMSPRHGVGTSEESAQLALIVESQQAIATAAGSFAELMQLVAERAVRLTGAAAAVVEVPRGDEMVYVAAAGAAAGHEGVRLAREGSLSGLCVREERTLVALDTELDERVDREACRRVGARSMLVVPLREATPEGAAAVKVYAPQPSALREQDGHALELMAELTAATMRRSSDLDAEREQVERLRELDRLKDDVVAVVTHELRTPITSIGGYLEVILEEPEGLDPQTLTFLRTIERNSDRLRRLVDDLLLLLRGDSRKLELRREPVDLARIADESLAAIAPIAERKLVEVDAEVARPCVADVDEARVAQALDNLLSNAVKYTPDGGRVRVVLRQAHGEAELSVSDTGIGIPRSEQAHLFERFFRASSATERGISGTGLGLAIVRAIVEAHGGRIGFESESGRGTTFRVVLPTGVSSARAA